VQAKWPHIIFVSTSGRRDFFILSGKDPEVIPVTPFVSFILIENTIRIHAHPYFAPHHLLYGRASNAAELNLAAKLANDVNGVKGVKNRMTIE
jgi:hypothetical protein